MQMAAGEVADGSAQCALLVTTDRCSNGPIVYYPDPTAPGGTGHTERWVLDNFAHDPHAKNAMIDTAENVAAKFGVSTGEQHEVTLARYAQYQQALANDRAFQRRYMVDAADHRLGLSQADRRPRQPTTASSPPTPRAWPNSSRSSRAAPSPSARRPIRPTATPA